MQAPRGSLQEFLEDMEPFFYRRSLLYVDVGAYNGAVFKKVLASRLTIREAHLIEPNPSSAEALKRNIGGLFKGHIISVHNVALGAQSGTVRIRRAESMTKVVDPNPAEEPEPTSDSGTFVAPCYTLDQLSESFSDRHIALLKLDVEGFENQVLAGAAKLLKDQDIDVIYVEAGMNPSGTQQCYFRDIDDTVLAHGYRLFRIYEQMHEWPEDSPFLRRVNLAYFSRRFAERNPRLLTRELFDAKTQLQSVEAERDELSKRLDALSEVSASQRKALAAEQGKSASLAAERAELTHELQMAKRDGAAHVQRTSELEAQVRAATLDGDELRQRLALVVKAHQNQLIQLTEDRQARRDLEAHLGVVEESVQALTLRLTETTRRAEDLSAERDELTQRITQLTRRDESRTRRLAELERDLRDARAKARKLRELPPATGKQAHRSEDRRRLAAISEEIAREVFGLYDALYRRERRVRRDAARFQELERRTRGHLSYRLGTALVTNSRSPAAWARIPVAVGRAYSEFRRDARERAQRVSPVLIEVLGAPPVTVGMPLKTHRNAVRILDGGPREVWARALCVRPAAVVTMEFALGPAGSHSAAMERAASEAGEGASPGFGPAQSAELRAGVPAKLVDLPAGSGDLDLQMHRVSGVPTIVHLEVRPAGAVPEQIPIAERIAAEPAVPAEPSSLLRAPGDPSQPEAGAKRATPAPAAKQDNPIWLAHTMLGAGHYEEGIQFARANASDLELPAVELLSANYFLDDEQAWLSHVNKYVQQFGVAAIELLPTGSSRYARLSASCARRVEAGPLVSVLMPAFNAERTLELAARSVLSQTWQPLELIIMDDASEDSTWSVAQRLASEDSRVKLLRSPSNVGPYVAKNLGLLIAQGSYITGHDADDWAHPERIEHHVEAMLRSDGLIQASVTKMLRLTAEGQFSSIGKKTENVDDGVLQTAFISCMLEARLLRERLGFWDSVRFGADSELISRVKRVIGTRFAVLRQLSMLCLTSGEGLTADPVHGASRAHGMSPARVQYKKAFTEWHGTIDRNTAYLPFPHRPRRFKAPEVALVSDRLVVDLTARSLVATEHTPTAMQPAPAEDSAQRVDVCIITDLAFPGGNASSTLDEVRTCLAAGLSVRLLHCPTPSNAHVAISQRYADYAHLCDDGCFARPRCRCDVLIVRHPGVVCTPTFSQIVGNVQADAAVIVINNSLVRADGANVYFEDELCTRIAAIPAKTKTTYPLGPVIRGELLASSIPGRLDIGSFDWTPTFSADAYPFRGARPMGHPIVIGRHGRDGREKWLEDTGQLAIVYPSSEDIKVRILGGAKRAPAIPGADSCPWEILPFGSVNPADFLSGLDAFVYFPHSRLNEAFGRTVMEAIFVGVPCVLTARLEETFGEFAFCCEPSEAIPAVFRLKRSHAWCSSFVERARNIAVARYGSESVLERLGTVSQALAQRLGAAVSDVVPEAVTSRHDLRGYQRWICTGEGNECTYTDGAPSS